MPVTSPSCVRTIRPQPPGHCWQIDGTIPSSGVAHRSISSAAAPTFEESCPLATTAAPAVPPSTWRKVRRVNRIFPSPVTGVAVVQQTARRHGMRLRRRCFCRHGFLAALMAAYTFIHVESFERGGGRFGKSLHGSVTGLALYFCDDDMRAMWKEHMGRQTPYPPPGNLLSLFPVGAQLFNFLALGIAAGVTGHAQRRRRPPRHRAFFRALMAAGAGQVEIQMSLVGKGNGLLDAAAYPARRISPGQYSQADHHD